MANWSRAGQEPEDTTGESSPAEVPPPPLAPTARVAEILERFFLWDQRLTAELLAELARCSAADLAKLFDCAPPPKATADAENGARRPATEQPADGRRYGYSGPELSGAPQSVPTDPAKWRWDANGNRIDKLPSSFPRTRYEPPKRPGTHWSN
jgi:hypothetical protein